MNRTFFQLLVFRMGHVHVARRTSNGKISVIAALLSVGFACSASQTLSMPVRPVAIVIAGNVLRDRADASSKLEITGSWHPLGFKAPKKSFGGCIVPAVSSAAKVFPYPATP